MATSVKHGYFIKAKISAKKFLLTPKWKSPRGYGTFTIIKQHKEDWKKKIPTLNKTAFTCRFVSCAYTMRSPILFSLTSSSRIRPYP